MISAPFCRHLMFMQCLEFLAIFTGLKNPKRVMSRMMEGTLYSADEKPVLVDCKVKAI